MPAKHCPLCGGKFYKRSLDNPAVIKVRLKEYHERTEPIVKFAKKLGYHVVVMDGKPVPYLVYKKIYGYLNKNAA